MSENVRSHIGRIHHSLCWYKDRMQPSCGTMRGLEDMSVAGHDGSDVAASIKLTTMAQPAHNHPDRADARRYDAANRSRIAIGWPADGKGRRTGLQPIE